jgi:hypothetical protein
MELLLYFYIGVPFLLGFSMGAADATMDWDEGFYWLKPFTLPIQWLAPQFGIAYLVSYALFGGLSAKKRRMRESSLE